MSPVVLRFLRFEFPGLLALSVPQRLCGALCLLALMWAGVIWALSA